MTISKKLAAPIATVVALALVLPACGSDADVVSENLSKASDQFEIPRRVVFVNGITDSYLLSIQGRCSIEDEGHQLEVVCKATEGKRTTYKKHFLGLSDNVTYFVEQLDGAQVSDSQYRVVFKPSAIVPDIDIR